MTEMPQRAADRGPEKAHPSLSGKSAIRQEASAGSYFLGALSAYFFWKRSTRPAVSINFCLPVKKGWQLEQISTRTSWPF